MKKLFFSALAAVMLLQGCSDDSATNSGKTPVTIKMTDAPGLYDAILLNIARVDIITTGGKTSIPVTEFEPFDILEFSMGRDTLLARDEVTSGSLQEVRLVLHDQGNSVIIDGQEHALTTPSGQSSGVKIKIQDQLVPDMAYTLLLDFDAASSITTTGNGKYILKPVIRAIPNAVSGVIRGIVLPLDAHVKVYALLGEEKIGAVTNEKGEFYFPGIASGSYKISIEPLNNLYSPQLIENVTIENGEVKELGTITLTLAE